MCLSHVIFLNLYIINLSYIFCFLSSFGSFVEHLLGVFLEFRAPIGNLLVGSRGCTGPVGILRVRLLRHMRLVNNHALCILFGGCAIALVTRCRAVGGGLAILLGLIGDISGLFTDNVQHRVL